jgi:flavin-dependent dehydrogenase
VTKLDADVIVVGGGPAGSSTAWFLAQSGVDVLVLDRARFPRDKPCSEYLSPEASRILSAMGVLDAVERAGAEKLAGMVVTSPDGTLVRGDFRADHGFRGFRDYGLAIRRTILDEMLLRRAEAGGAGVTERCKVTDVIRSDSGTVTGVKAQREGEEPRDLKCRLVIGADGLRSVVGRRLGLIKSGWPRRIGLVSHYRGIKGMADAGEIHLERNGYCGFANVDAGITNAAIVVPMSRSSEISGDPTAFFENWFASRPRFAWRLASAERVSPIRATGPFATSARVAWTPGAALVGDAADFFDPITGEGVYAALRGGELLAEHALTELSDNGNGRHSGLKAYEAARRRAFSGKWKVEKLLGYSIESPAVMNHLARVLRANKPMADLMVGVSGDFIPPSEILNARFLLKLALARGASA